MVTVAFMANAIRSYFGDGSEFGVRMVYATEETPLGTAGSVRNARDELDERFLVISGDVLTDIDLTTLVAAPRLEGGAGHDRAQGGGQSARVRDRHHPRGRVDRAVPGEAHLGPGLQRHHQHRHLRARARDLRLHPRGPGRGLLRGGLPGRARGREAPVRLRGRGLLGGRRAPSTPTSGPTRTSSTRTSPSRSAVLPRPGRLAGQGGRARPDGRGQGPGHHRRQLPRRARAASWASTASSAPTPASGTTPRSSAPSSTTTPSSAPASGSTAASSAGPVTCARVCGARRAWSSATSPSSGPTP